MLNNFIGGGQVFLHRVRMFSQVFLKTLIWGVLIGKIVALSCFWSEVKSSDWRGFLSYQKASIAVIYNDSVIIPFKNTIGDNDSYEITIDAYSFDSSYLNERASKIKEMHVFKNANQVFLILIKKILILSSIIAGSTFLFIFSIWSYFGKELKSETRKSGGQVLSATEVRKRLKSANKASDIMIGRMPLIKDMETRHFLISGSTGSGKTNLIHNILPQVENKNYPAIVIDQTGEMIAKYYTQERGDVIINPLDARGVSWNFWKDTQTKEDLERFTKILFSFNRQKSGYNSDPFWEESAQTVFMDCVLYQKSQNNYSIDSLINMVRYNDLKTLQQQLAGTTSARYLTSDGKTTASSILAVLASTIKPLSYLRDNSDNGEISLKTYFNKLKKQNPKDHIKQPWIFLATDPSSRELTLPLIACIANLILTELIRIGIDKSKQRKIWFVIDELASLGKLPTLSPLMAEGRKYGACVVAGLQSLNQLYVHYGRYDGSVIFGQFGSNFFFRNNEAEIGQMFSSMCGAEIITRQQKNTSFGANEFRDGVSYTEQEHKKNLVEYSDLASLGVGECYAIFPEPEVRLSKIQTPEVKIIDKAEGFVEKKLAANLVKDSHNKKFVTENLTSQTQVLPKEEFTTSSDDSNEKEIITKDDIDTLKL
ncbi:MAG: hypothetical protein DGJ47_001069 [Rickettsiaceae bacterium]